MENDQQASSKRNRSPGYPGFSLVKAVDRAELLYKHDKRNAVPIAVAAQHWGYSPQSSGVLVSIATLKKFGLLEEVSGGSVRQLKLTDLALHIILSPSGSEERRNAIRTAAMLPAIHVELWEKYHEELPSDANLKRILIMERGFGDKAADDLIQEYKETISFANVTSSVKELEEAMRNPANEPEMLLVSGQNAERATNQNKQQITAGLREYRFPLIDAPDVQLRLPAPVTEENFNLLKDQLESFLKVTRRALIKQNINQDAAE
jgi:hypothetical protein